MGSRGGTESPNRLGHEASGAAEDATKAQRVTETRRNRGTAARVVDELGVAEVEHGPRDDFTPLVTPNIVRQTAGRPDDRSHGFPTREQLLHEKSASRTGRAYNEDSHRRQGSAAATDREIRHDALSGTSRTDSVLPRPADTTPVDAR